MFVCGEAQTIEWLLLLLLLLVLLLYYWIYARYRKTYKNKSVDTSDIRYRANFQPSVTSIFAKNCRKWFCIFFAILQILLFWSSKWPQSSNVPDTPNITWWCPIFYIFFLYDHTSVPQKSILKFFLIFLFHHLNFKCIFWQKNQITWKCVSSNIKKHFFGKLSSK